MKIIRVLFLTVGIISSLKIASAQTNLQSAIEAVQSTTPFPASEAPAIGNFYSAQLGASFPPYPGDINQLPFWSLGNGIYVYDDREVDYAAMNPPDELGASGHNHALAMPSFFSPWVPSCGTGGAAYITNFSAVVAGNQTMTVTFDISGGVSNVIYDILVATNISGVPQWTWLGQGFTCNTYTFYNQPKEMAFYKLGPPPASMVVAWGDDSAGECDIPLGLTNVVAVAGGAEFSIALKSDGTVVAWGDNSHGQTDVPSGLSNVVAIASGMYHNLALKADGTIVAWGDWDFDNIFSFALVPTNLSNVVSVSAGYDHDLALKADGTVVSWGYTNEIYNTVPTNLPGTIAIAAAWNHNVALLNNGSVTAWGINGAVLGWNLTTLPPDLTNANIATAVTAWALHSLALRSDGTVEAWGEDADGQTNVPSGLTNVISLAAGESHSMALTQGGNVILWGDLGDVGPLFIPQGLSGVIAIGAGAQHCMAICPGSLPPVIVTEPTNAIQLAGDTVTFTAKGAGGAFAVFYQWQCNGTNIVGATNSTCIITNVQSENAGIYDVIISDVNGSITSSNATLELLTAPVIESFSPAPGSTNYVTNSPLYVLPFLITLTETVSAPATNEFKLSYQWFQNGVAITGATNASLSFYSTPYTAYWQTNPVDGEYYVQVGNIAGTNQSGTCAIKFVSIPLTGMAVAWGNSGYGENEYPILSNVMGIAAGYAHSVAVLTDGTINQWGDYWDGEYYAVGATPAFTNLVAAAAGAEHDIGLTANGQVVTWGLSNAAANFVPTNLPTAIAVACGWNHNLALLTNKTVAAWGIDGAIYGWHLTEVPPDLTNGSVAVSAIAAGALHSIALRADGTVESWGYNPDGETNVPSGLSNVVAIAAGEQHSLALKSDGTVVGWGDNTFGQITIPAGLSNVMAIAAGSYHSVALQNDGTVVAWGDNADGQTNVIPTLADLPVKSIAAGGDHTVALTYSPAIQYYPLDVAQDLLLIYNTNSADSATVLNYYLANRPGVSNANVLGIGFAGFYITNFAYDGNHVAVTNITDYETISPNDFTNQMLIPIANWFLANPTKKPQYVVLMLDVPSRVDASATSPTNFPFYGIELYSVSHQLSDSIPGWQPRTTHINMNGTNDCIGYINKIAALASNTPGQLLISASATGYGNTNYVLDGIRFGGPSPYEDFTLDDSTVASGTNGLLASGVSSSAILFFDGLDTKPDGIPDFLPHATGQTNVAGYMCWGAHSSLGPDYPIYGYVRWNGNSSWYLIETVESYNGQRYIATQGNYIEWFSPNAFGGTNYSNTPIGAVSHVNEPQLNINDPSIYFGEWASGKPFIFCAWDSKITFYFQAVGDPFITR